MKKNEKPVVLPRVLSDLLEIALDDMAALRRAGKVQFDMSEWLYNRPQDKTCSVCMAGAVMLRRGLVTSRISTYDEEYDLWDCDYNNDQLGLINDMRCGRFHNFEGAAPWTLQQQFEVRGLVNYFGDAKMENDLFPETMYRYAIERLRSVGL